MQDQIVVVDLFLLLPLRTSVALPIINAKGYVGILPLPPIDTQVVSALK